MNITFLTLMKESGVNTSTAQAMDKAHIATATATGAHDAFIAVLAAETILLICIIIEVRNSSTKAE